MSDSLISVVIPVYNEVQHISTSILSILEVFRKNSIPCNIILIDDGSTDGTWSILNKLSADNTEITAFRLSRNFGKESAICAGLDMAQGDACIVMDADLQHPPELIPKMVELWKQGYDIVEAVKSSRGNEPLYNKLGASLFYSMLSRLAGIDIQNASDFKLMDARVIRSWRMFGERNTFFRALSNWLGYKRTSVYFEVPERKAGSSKWSVFKLIKLAIHAIASFSSVPLQLVSIMGILFFIASVVLGIHTLFMKLSGQAASGFTTVILLQLFIGSLLMISLGIIGTYIAKIFEEVKRRPRYIISEKTGESLKKNIEM